MSPESAAPAGEAFRHIRDDSATDEQVREYAVNCLRDVQAEAEKLSRPAVLAEVWDSQNKRLMVSCWGGAFDQIDMLRALAAKLPLWLVRMAGGGE